MKIYNTILTVFLLGFIFLLFRYDMSHYGNAIQNFSNNASDEVRDILHMDNLSDKSELTNAPGPLRVDTKLLDKYNTIHLYKKNVIDITNEMRKNENLPILKENNKLDLSAYNKLQDMFKEQYFEHDSPSGVGVGDLGQEVFYEYIIIGENLALGNFKDDRALVDAWMASPGHRANILNPKYTEIGVAVGSGVFEGRDVWMAVQHFGKPANTCPLIDSLLKSVIEFDQKTLEKMEYDMKLRRAKIDSGEVYEGLSVPEQTVKFNLLVEQYNNLLNELKEKISTYNAQVKEYNKCIL